MIDQIVITQIATTLLAFGIFFWLAKKLFWTGIIKTIEERQKHIRDQFDAIDRLKEETAALQSNYERHMANIEAESRQKIQEAIAHGRELAEHISDQARREADAMLERTRESCAIEIDKARAKLREDVIKITMRATEKLIRERLDERKHHELVGAFIDEIVRK